MRRLVLGVLTVWLASLLVFAATQVLPGNAAYAVLGHSATPERIRALEAQLHLNDSAFTQYWTWMSGVLQGNPGRSLASGLAVSQLVLPRIGNSAVLVGISGVIGSLLGVSLGIVAAARRDGWFDHASSAAALAIVALPEFVVAIALVIVFAGVALRVLPAVSVIPLGGSLVSNPQLLVLPAATLVIVITPYIARMTRGAMVDALESEYVELARLKGVGNTRILIRHALPNALGPIIQVIALSLLYLAGGIVVVEYVFNFPGVGQELVAAVGDRDIPVIQFLVIALAAFYVLVNVAADMVALSVSPRRRLGG